MKKLNQRQLIFCNQIFLGKSATESAIIAGYSPKTAYSIASENLRKPEIRLELARRNAELKAKINNDKIMTEEERKIRLAEIAKAELRTPIFASDSIRAISELNKMDGSYAPERKQIDLNVDVVFVIGKGYRDRDEQTLKLEDGNSDKAQS